MAVSPAIIEALKRLNPTREASSDEYVSREWEGMPRGWDLPERLEVLVAAGYRVRALLHGPIGVGKSTELKVWKEKLNDVAYVLHGRVTNPDNWTNAHLVERILRSFLARTLRDEPDPQMKELADQVERVDSVGEKYVEKMPLLVERIRRLSGRQPLFFWDGLDLLREEKWEAVFGPGSPLCSDDFPSVVWIAPHSFLSLSSREDRDPRFEHVWSLPAFGVVDREGNPNPPAIRHFALGLMRRVADLDAFLDADEVFSEIAFLSGGIPRDAIRILNAAVLAAARVGKVNAAHVRTGIQEVRQDLSQSLREEDWAALKRVADTGNHLGAWNLVSHNAIIAYEGPEERYWRPHPLLWSLVAERARGR